jgi:integrase
MTHFKFGPDFITETQALDQCYVRKVAVKGHGPEGGWGWRGFTAKNAQAVANGDRKGDPKKGISYRSGDRQLKKPDGSPYLVSLVSETYAKGLAKALVREEVRKARHQVEQDAQPIYLKVRHMTIVEGWREWRGSEKLTNPFENKLTTKAYNTSLKYLQNYNPKLVCLRDIRDGFWDDFRKTNDAALASNGKPHSVSYKNKNEARFQHFIEYLQSKQYLDPSLALGQFKGRKENPIAEDNADCPFDNEQELEVFFRYCLSKPQTFIKTQSKREEYVLQLTILAYSAIRDGDEFHKLVWEDIDFDKHRITIKSASAKGGHQRTVGMLPPVKEALRSLQLIQSKGSFPSPTSLVLPNSYTALHRAYFNWIRGYLDGTGKTGFRLHLLRSFAMDHMIHTLHLDQATVAAWTGASGQTMDTYYRKRDQKNLAQEKLDQIYRDYEGKQGGDDQKEVG